MRLEQVVHRIATDSEFAASVMEDLEAALHRADIDVSEGELEALRSALETRKQQKNGSANHTWYEAALGKESGKDLPQNHTWYESQLGAETT